MNPRILPLFSAFAVLFGNFVSLRAQVVADGATNTLSNTTNSFASVTVGTNGSFTLLTLSNNALLTNSGNGTIGLNATAKSNEVRLVGPTASWRMGGSLIVGSNGAFSRLVISNGAVLEDFDGNLGFRNASSNNSALVTGPGSLWTNRNSFFMSGGFLVASPSNRLVVSDSGALVSGGTVTVGGFGNQVLITGAGSRWVNQSDFNFAGTGNRLELREGAALLVSSNSILGDLLASFDTNSVLLADVGTAWTNSGDVTIGFSRTPTFLTASNGASMFVGGRVSLGALSGANFNSLSINDPGTSLTVGSGLFVGSGSSANVLAINNGGLVVSSNGIVGASLGASANLARVSGPGSVWSNRNDLIVGDADRDNRLVISDGAMVHAGGIGSLGLQVNSRSNSVIVTDPGSRLLTAGNLYVGSNSALNALVISNGGRVDSGFSYLGFNASSSNNEALVTGTGSIWSASANLDVGNAGGGNRLVVSNGGRMRNTSARIGGFGSSNNLVLITGPDSSWTNLAGLIVGTTEGGNRLVVSNAGLVSARGITVGFGGSAANNRIVVDGGSLLARDVVPVALEVRRGTNVFNAGLIDADLLLMTNALGKFEFNGGTLVTRGAVIGNGANFVVGTSGSTPAIWDVRAGLTNTFVGGDLIVGSNASFNQLILTNGALLTNSGLSAYGILGWQFGANSNNALIVGSDSRWFLEDGLIVGTFGSGNRVVVSNGASLLTGSSSVIGNELISSNNEVVVTGPGSSWSSGVGQMFVGGGGRNNRLVVSDGAQVVSFLGRIGDAFPDTTNNLALVTGSGSSWSNTTDLYVGNVGARNWLVVSNGGTVAAGSVVYLGLAATSTNNRAVVDGGTLRVTNAAVTGLLDVRRGTNVINAGLVEVDVLRITNTLGQLELNGGQVSAKSSRINNGVGLRIGDGTSPATFELAGNGYHFFDTVIVFANGTLTGNGTIGAPAANALAVLDGGTLSPGASIGRMVFTNNLLLFGKLIMEISKTGAALTNDQVQALGGLSYGGELIVTNLGPMPLSNGDKFHLFASPAAGSFQSLTLPPLPAPLSWTNKLEVDGSIEVIAPPAILMSSGTYTQSFDSLALSGGGSNPWRDNVTLRGWYAAKTVVPNSITNYRASDGSDNAGALYSFGSLGSSERALGSIGSGGVGDLSYGLGFLNDLNVTVSNFFVTFTGEQWRCSSSLNSNTLTFWYRVTAAPITDPEPGTTNNWTPVTALDFISPTVLATGAPLDGNQSTNRQFFSGVLIPGLAVPPGQSVFFRWRDLDDIGTDQGMALDDLIVAFSPLGPQLTAIVVNPTNHFVLLTGRGESNVTYAIEAATNLTPPIFWQRIDTNAADPAGIFQLTDTNAPTFPMRFYRATFP
ncbi:MAG TPA: hypothetical protein VFZ59_27075 [Verrucomicrobiae bacterium]|nr:hypothetical protein [Verrucomicrobiae bacterium]